MNNYIEKLNQFLKHLKNSADEMLDIIADNKDYEERFDIKISINGKQITIPLCADSYYRLEQFINDEIKEEELGG
jgi:hypothetical protein